MAFIREIIEQHPEEAAFLWHLRRAAVASPNYDLNDLAELDERIEAHMDALRIVGEDGWQICMETLDFEEPGALFVLGGLAFVGGKRERIATTLALAGSDRELKLGAASALACIPFDEAAPCLQSLFESHSPDAWEIGLSATAAQGRDPGKIISEALCSGVLSLKTTALRAAGELGRKDLLPMILDHVMDEDEDCRFWACWSACIFGDMTATAILKSFAASVEYGEKAASLAARRMPAKAAEQWRDQLFQSSEFKRLAVVCAGAAGDPTAIPWLLGRMAEEPLARLAGKAFAMITGADISEDGFERPAPLGFETGPGEAPEDDDATLDPDENLPWPDPAAIERWWSGISSSFEPDLRYFLGKPIEEASLWEILLTGVQVNRAEAALELAFLCPGKGIFQTAAPALRQLEILEMQAFR